MNAQKTFTTRVYECGCEARGSGNVPLYCGNHGTPPTLSSNPTNIDRLLHASRVAAGFMCEMDNAGARHITQLVRDALKPWDEK